MFFFFNDTATTEIYTLSLHDALPISLVLYDRKATTGSSPTMRRRSRAAATAASASCSDRKSTRLNSSHLVISYAVFCLKKKNTSRASHPGGAEGHRRHAPAAGGRVPL